MQAEYKVPTTVISAVLGLSLSSVGNILKYRQGWNLSHLSKIAQYFHVTTDELIFGDKDFISKSKKQSKAKFQEIVYEYLVKENATITLGELVGSGYFSDVDIHYLAKKHPPKKK